MKNAKGIHIQFTHSFYNKALKSDHSKLHFFESDNKYLFHIRLKLVVSGMCSTHMESANKSANTAALKMNTQQNTHNLVTSLIAHRVHSTCMCVCVFVSCGYFVYLKVDIVFRYSHTFPTACFSYENFECVYCFFS